MANRGHTSESDTEVWLPPELRDQPSTGTADNGSGTNGVASDPDQWLEAPEDEAERPAHEEAAGDRPEAEELAGEEEPLRRANEKLRAQEDVIKGLNARVGELEAQLESSSNSSKPNKRRPTKGRPAPMPMEPSAGRPTKPKLSRKARKRGAALDLNSASFEELRGVGLSVTQSARVIAYRDTRGGFGSLDDLAAVPGFSRETISSLRLQVEV
jgi:hypothetical protein